MSICQNLQLNTIGCFPATSPPHPYLQGLLFEKKDLMFPSDLFMPDESTAFQVKLT